MRSALLLVAFGLGACTNAPVLVPAIAPEPAPPVIGEGIAGVVAASGSSEPLPNAIVILEGTTDSRETTTTAAGRFFIPDVPAGTYSLQVLYGEAEATRIVEHDGESRMLAEFALDPVRLL
jgi:hypothetical protein